MKLAVLTEYTCLSYMYSLLIEVCRFFILLFVMKFLEINKFVIIYVLDMLGTCYITLFFTIECL